MLSPDPNAADDSPLHRDAPRASTALLAAALSGLLGLGAVAGCSDGTVNPEPGQRPTGDAAADAGADVDDRYNNAIMVDAAIPMEVFQSLCDERGGYVYVNSSCSGSSMCKGLSFHNGTLWDHSCRGQNSTCSGVGCVVMPKDTGLTGKEIYEDGPCGNCHGDWSGQDPDFSKFALFYNPRELTGDFVAKRFAESPEKRLEAIIVWGVAGFHDDFTPYANMPAYYQKYSIAETKRVTEHVRTMTTFLYPTDIYGRPPLPEGGPEGGVRDAGSTEDGNSGPH